MRQNTLNSCTSDKLSKTHDILNGNDLRNYGMKLKLNYIPYQGERANKATSEINYYRLYSFKFPGSKGTGHRSLMTGPLTLISGSIQFVEDHSTISSLFPSVQAKIPSDEHT